MPPFPMSVHQGAVRVGIFSLGNLREFVTLLRVVGDVFAKNYRLHEGNRFVSSKKRK